MSGSWRFLILCCLKIFNGDVNEHTLEDMGLDWIGWICVLFSKHAGRSKFVFVGCDSLVLHAFKIFFCLMQVVWGLDQVTLLNPPQEPLPDHHLKILYSCDEPATVQLDCIVSFDTGISSTFPLREWSCIPNRPKVRTLELKLPDWLVYQTDGIIPDYQGMLSCILVVSLRHNEFDDDEKLVKAQDVASLHIQPFFNRPVKQHQLCIAWSAQMLQFAQGFSSKQCPVEQGKESERATKSWISPQISIFYIYYILYSINI